MIKSNNKTKQKQKQTNKQATKKKKKKKKKYTNVNHLQSCHLSLILQETSQKLTNLQFGDTNLTISLIGETFLSNMLSVILQISMISGCKCWQPSSSHVLIFEASLFRDVFGLFITASLPKQGFFPGGELGGPPIRRKFCQFPPHPTLVPVFGPRLFPPSRGSFLKIWKI